MSDIFGGESEGIEEVEQQAELPEVEEELEGRTPSEVEKPDEFKQDSRVPLSALNESRAQLRQTQNEVAQLRQTLEGLQSMRQELDEYRNRVRQTAAEEQFNSDPLGVLREQVSKLSDKIDYRAEEQESKMTAAQRDQQVFYSIASQVNEFKKSAPDYDDALQHVLSSRKSEFEAMGMYGPQIDEMVANEARQIAMTALQNGHNPGKVVYELAKVRGYAGKKASEKIARISKGQESSRSLSGTSGDSGDTGFSLTEIDSMSDEEFDAFWDKEMKPKRR